MIKTNKLTGVYTIGCDEPQCEQTSDYPNSLGWKEFLVEARKDGWSTPKNDKGEWDNFCPSCASTKRQKRAVEKEIMMASAPKKLEKGCPKCKSDMFLRKSKFGGFYGCSGYPGCSEKLTVSQGINLSK